MYDVITVMAWFIFTLYNLQHLIAYYNLHCTLMMLIVGAVNKQAHIALKKREDIDMSYELLLHH